MYATAEVGIRGRLSGYEYSLDVVTTVESVADLAVFVIAAEGLTISPNGGDNRFPNAGDTRQIVANIFLWALKLGQYRLFGVHVPSYN